MKRVIYLVLFILPMSVFGQNTIDHLGKIRMRYNNGGSPDTLLIQFSGDSVLYDANNPFHKFKSGLIADSLKLNGGGGWIKNLIPSQWTTSGSNIYYNTGNVGINNASPGYKLDVNGLIGGSNIETNTTSLSTKLGYEAGLNENETAAKYNSFIGYQAGRFNTTGSSNVFIGYQAGNLNTISIANTFIGTQSGYSNTTGTANVFNGSLSGYSNTTGSYNVFNGFHSGYSNTTGINNIIIGSYSRYYGNSSNELVIDNQKRGTTQNDSLLYRYKSLIYGKFDADTLNQEVDINGRLRYTGTYAEIHVHDASAAQSIPTGTTYTKLTCYTDNGESSNCTADAANDKITITKMGKYRVTASSSTTVSAAATFRFAAFLGGVEQDDLHSMRKFPNNDISGGILQGFITVTSVPIDVDIRCRHDQGGNVYITVVYSNFNVEYIGE